MKTSLMAPLVMISFMLVAGRSYSARLLDSNMFIAPANPPAFDPNLNSAAHGHVEKDVVQCDKENRGRRSSSAATSKNSNEINKLSFRLRPTIQNIKMADELRASKEDDGVLNLLPKGALILKVNSMQMTGQRLSKSKRSPGVGHMQMIHHKSQTRNVDIHRGNGDDKSNKLKLGSTTSPRTRH